MLNEDKKVTTPLREELKATALRLWRAPGTVFGGLVFIAALLFWFWRLQRGVDLSDEAFYVALPLRFALGDRPFLDERSSLQGAGLLEAPLVALFHLIVRDNHGLMLFMRVSYLGYLAGIGIALTNAVRGWIHRGAALACAGVVLFYAPYCIYQFSYNTLGGGLAILAALSVLRLSRVDPSRDKAEVTMATRYAILSGICVAGATLAYPTLAPLTVVHAATILVFGRRALGPVRVLFWYSLGGLLVCLYVGLFIIRSGLGSIKLTIDFVRLYGTTLTNDSASVIQTVESFKQDWFQTILVALGLTGVARIFRPGSFLVVICLPSLALSTSVYTDVSATIRYFTCLGLMAPLFAFLVDDRRRAFEVLAILWGPGVLTGYLTGVSSGNGGVATGLGGFACMLAGLILGVRSCEESLGRFRRQLGAISVVAPIAVLLQLRGLVMAESSVYRDARLSTLTATVRVGPFAGIRTTASHRDQVEQLHHDIIGVVGGTRWGLFYPDAPAAFLSTNVRVAAAEIWMGSISKRNEIDAQLFRARAQSVGIVVQRSCTADIWNGCSADRLAANPIQKAVSETHTPIIRRPGYWILIPKEAASPDL